MAFARISSTAWGTMSVATTRAPALAARTAASPSPLPISSTRSPERTARCRQKNNDPAFGSWTPPATRNTEPRQVKRSSPASLPSKNLPEVEAKGFLDLSAPVGTVENAAVRLISAIGPHLQDVRVRLRRVRANGEADRLAHFVLAGARCPGTCQVALRSVGVAHGEVRREVAEVRGLGVERPLRVLPACDDLFFERRHRHPLLGCGC